MSNSLFSAYSDNPAVKVHGAGHTDHSAPLHHLSSSWFVFEYILSGEECIESPDILINAGIGDLVIIHPSEECVIYRNSSSVSAMYFYISGFVLEAASEVLSLPRVSVISASLLESFMNITAMYEKYNAGDPSAGIGFCELAFSLLLRAAENGGADVSGDKPSAKRIKDYLDLCLCGDIDLDQVGRKFGISGMHVIRLFRQEYEYTPMQYLKLRRIEKAASLLSSSDMSIKDISSLLCFSSTQHFTNLFRDHYGTSPGKYRDAQRKAITEQRCCN